ncbi:NAD(P)H-binding protein [Pontibacter fetidus]|uniref:NAD(P)H-binding protein n=1 Tax=Pontibacter fetidus TaxID=2700082 RepID=A0A6B2H0X8_9BACT|nr:NAD(P)H-binding protein [Pontibacter fetidus]NDK56755.1 NAD(P)H-binding protein [Pontibacter fetidus]
MEKQNYILILGAGGNIGGKIADRLLAQEVTVGVVGRNPENLKRFEGKAELWLGDFNDDTFLKEALRKASSLFLTVPDSAFSDLNATAARLARLLKDTPVTHIVNISNSIIKKAGQATRLVALEAELNYYLEQHMLHLRCGNFFENLNWGLHTPYAPDLKLPYVSSYEVAHVAAAHLLQQDFTGKQVQALTGNQDYSMAELAAAAGVNYRQLPYSDENVHFYKPFNEGDFEVEPRLASYTLADEQFTLAYFLKHDLKAEAMPV